MQPTHVAKFDASLRGHSLPPEWRGANSDEDAVYARQLVEHTMTPYWARRQMRFSGAMFASYWRDYEALILEHAGRRSGIIAWQTDEVYANLRELHLDEQVRGQGRGAAILNAWLSFSRSVGARRARLRVFAENPARHLYQRAGFDVTGSDARVQGLLTMERRL
ncbi:GNAT family N-acetyltransferase [Carnimonas bestiolae]|uniref:GNAT family N-acetyltransferase n=1 Tax=Carnimonas bestiolae TaxID=3402172 RepID=UPI003EDC33C9